jgi:hypothetical protein
MVARLMDRPRSLAVCVVIAVSILTAPAVALAQPAATGKRAEQLYDEALALVDKRNYAEACPRFEESQRLDPALGTQFNLADCYEHIARSGSALRLFREVARAARSAGKSKLEASANGRAELLAARAPQLVIKLGAAEIGAFVTIDGENAGGPSSWAEGIPVDPGEHVVEVVAPGKKRWRRTVGAGDGDRLTVEVPKLESAEGGVLDPKLSAPILRPHPAAKPMRIAGATTAGVGVVAAVVGTIFALDALSSRADARRLCDNVEPEQCRNEAGLPHWHDAKVSGNVSTVAFVASGVLVASGVVLWFAAPSPRPGPTVGVAAKVGGDRDLGLGLRGTW